MRYQTLAMPATVELEISRSRFLGLVERVETETEAREVIARVRSAHPKATHHCSAFVLEPGQLVKRSNDDGEPSGTAGAPMLDALLSSGLSDVVAVVTRYFGGVLLGAGGLTRAYRATVAEAVQQARLVERDERWEVSTRTSYDVAAQLEAEARRRGWIVGDANYSDTVQQTYLMPSGEIEALAVLAAEISAGAAEVQVGSSRYVDLPQ